MAAAVIEVKGIPTGLTITVDLYPFGSDTAAASGITMTEATNRKSTYTGTTTAALTGLHDAKIKLGSVVIADGVVSMDDTTAVHRVLGQDYVSVGTLAGQLNVSGGKAPATIAAGDIATDAITAASVKADAVTKIQAGLSTLTAAGVWDTLMSTITTASSVGKLLKDYIDAAVSTRLATASYTAPDNTNIATAATNTTTILARIGAFTGTGANTILGFFKALLKKDAATPSDIGGTFNPATDSTEALADAGALGTTPETFWDYESRTLTSAGAITIVSPVTSDGNRLSLNQGDAYLDADGRALAIDVTAGALLPNDITTSTVTLRLESVSGTGRVVFTGTIDEPIGATKTFLFDLTAADTLALKSGAGAYRFRVVVLLDDDADHPATVWAGLVDVAPRIADPPVDP